MDLQGLPLFLAFFENFENLVFPLFSGLRGERGIRTPGPVTVNSFQDCRIRPLCHFSNMSLSLLIASANIVRFSDYKNFFSDFFKLIFKCLIISIPEVMFFLKLVQIVQNWCWFFVFINCNKRKSS